MAHPDDPRTPQPPDLSAGGVRDLCRLLDGLDLLDQLLALPTRPGEEGDVPLGRFRVRRRLGAGRFGVVFLAADAALRRDVVVKVPQPAVLAEPKLRVLFAQEALAAGQLDHPGIVPIHEAGEDRGLSYLVAGFVDGPTLAAWRAARPEPFDPWTAARLVELLAHAVGHAHDRGVLHCDLKPANVLLSPTGPPRFGVRGVGWPRVTDFGLARPLETDASPPAGTPLYMAPEQAAGRPRAVTRRTDVWSLGAILYELLTGRPPFPAEGIGDVLREVASEGFVPPRRLAPDIPHALEAVCLRCLETDPGDRYPSAAALAEDLNQFLSGRPVRARRYGPVERTVLWVRRRPETFGLFVLLVLLGVLTALSIARECR